MQSVAPLYRHPRISQALKSKAMLRSWETRIPGHIPELPGDPPITVETAPSIRYEVTSEKCDYH
jgi:hypothetical protein